MGWYVNPELAPTLSRLQQQVYSQLGTQRIAKLFDIVVEWPDSQPCLLDLQTCLQHADLRPRLVSDFKAGS